MEADVVSTNAGLAAGPLADWSARSPAATGHLSALRPLGDPWSARS